MAGLFAFTEYQVMPGVELPRENGKAGMGLGNRTFKPEEQHMQLRHSAHHRWQR